jgi:hypothetical protein
VGTAVFGTFRFRTPIERFSTIDIDDWEGDLADMIEVE